MSPRLSGAVPPPEEPDTLPQAIVRSLGFPGVIAGLMFVGLLVERYPASIQVGWVMYALSAAILLAMLAAIPFAFFAALFWWIRRNLRQRIGGRH